MMKTKIFVKELNQEITVAHDGSLLYAVACALTDLGVAHVHDDNEVILVDTLEHGVVHVYPIRTWRVRK